MWRSIPKVAKVLQLNPETIHGARKIHPQPDWIKKVGKVWKVDTSDPGFDAFVKKKLKRSTTTKNGINRTKQKKKIAENAMEILSEDETNRLQELSIQADLSQPIVKLRLERYKIEKQKIDLEKTAGDLIERSLADFLYTGYLDRLNRENLQYQNKIGAEIERLLFEKVVHLPEGEEPDPKEIASSIVKLITREQEEILRNVKKQQLKALEQWASDNGVSL